MMGTSTLLREVLDKGSELEVVEALGQFNKENEKAREIVWLAKVEKEQIWRGIFRRLEDPEGNHKLLSPLLNALRILSREKAVLESVMTLDLVQCLIDRAGLSSEEGPTGPDNLNGMKVIFNMIFQSETLQAMFISQGLLRCLVKHSDVSRTGIPKENRFFLLKIFFIITALRKSSGALVRKELNGIEVLLDLVQSLGAGPGPYDNQSVDVISEVLKVLYNLIHDMFPNRVELTAEMFGSDFPLLVRLCQVIKRNLVKEGISPEKKIELSVHCTHLLCAIPQDCYGELLTDDPGADVEVVGFIPIEAIVHCLDVKLDGADRGPAEPILVALCKLARNREIRRYLKQRILPPLTKEDLRQPPKMGSSIRNKLCSLIHTPSGNSTEVAANLIFILCKENVSKMVKYTGYGNAAGLLANRGLMLGGKSNEEDYSTDSDQSDTEEYTELKNKINDVEGWMKPEAPPLEMTEEQKELEALKLVDTINKLTNSKAIQPCRIGPDGKPQPIEHVLELQEASDSSIKSISRAGGSDTDSD